MPFTLEEIEYLHDRGLMPDWAYYSQNGKSAQENYDAQCKKRQLEFEKERYNKLQEKQLEKEIEAELEQLIEKVLDDILKDFNK